jgi:NADPH:quinone reductase-like Zn-dependent oxidoreductase
MALQNRGLLKTGLGKAAVASIPIPRLRDDYILVKTIAVALNPTDWQTVDEIPKSETTRLLLGCDYAGIVVEAGKDVTKNFKKGDRIAGGAHGGEFLGLQLIRMELMVNIGNDLEPEDGTFAEYIVVKGDVAIHIPDNISFEEAATLGCGIFTNALGLYRYLELPLLTFPLEEKRSDGPPLLIYGGSSASGTLAIQFAKLLAIILNFPKNLLNKS